jgi:hypothetical protein
MMPMDAGKLDFDALILVLLPTNYANDRELGLYSRRSLLHLFSSAHWLSLS